MLPATCRVPDVTNLDEAGQSTVAQGDSLPLGVLLGASGPGLVEADQIQDRPRLGRVPYLSNLTCLIRGNYEWGVRAGRNTDPDGRHPGAVRVATSPVTTTPIATGAPSDVPCIGWWWQALPTDASAAHERAD
ncbi:hypothetical protein OH779_39340 [Actinacidiphila glaucinigra]|uniref:hypothetical protein n=1 Tax=Actinacidiphila glaucinigra TaxID=235986 RepID=UPI00386FF37D